MHFHGLKSLSLTASLDTTAVPGILTNSTDDPIAANNRQDYSFKPHVDTPDPITLVYDGTADVGSRLAGSDLPSSFYYDDTPQHDGSHGAIVLKVWCKDFGGNCEIEFSGTAEFWGVTGTLAFSGLKVELPFTTRDAPLKELPFDEWLKREVGGPRELVDGQKSTWLRLYEGFKDECVPDDLKEEYEEIEKAVEETRKKLRAVLEAEADEPTTDREPKHPGRPYPYTDKFKGHKAEGDSLTMLQEYRGVYVTGGGFDAYGAPDPQLPGETKPWGDYRVRLSPARKELLVKFDLMVNVDDMPLCAEVKSILDTLSKGCSDHTNGCGVRLYYYMRGMVPHRIPASADERWDLCSWMPDPRGTYSEFVHLIFADRCSDRPTAAGMSGNYGAFVWVTRTRQRTRIDFLSTDLDGAIAHVAAHEVTHLLLDSVDTDGFNWEEELPNPDEDDTPRDYDDLEFLMYTEPTYRNFNKIVFSDPSRRNLNLTSKQSVERKSRGTSP